MGNVLKQEKQEQIRSLGRLGWSLRRIEEATGVRRETVSRYLRVAGITVRGHRKRRLEADSKAASEVTTDPGPAHYPEPARQGRARRQVDRGQGVHGRDDQGPALDPR